MGEIVAAFGTVHAPQLMIRPPDEDPQMLDASIAAMRELGKILDDTKPDAMVFLGSDHLETFSICMRELVFSRFRSRASRQKSSPSNPAERPSGWPRKTPE